MKNSKIRKKLYAKQSQAKKYRKIEQGLKTFGHEGRAPGTPLDLHLSKDWYIIKFKNKWNIPVVGPEILRLLPMFLENAFIN